MRPINVGERGQDMGSASLRSNNVLNVNTPDQQCVTNQRAVAAPGNRFGAHQDTTLSARQVRDPLNVVGELRGLHVVRIASKREILPARVWRIGSRMAQAAQASDEMRAYTGIV